MAFLRRALYKYCYISIKDIKIYIYILTIYILNKERIYIVVRKNMQE